MRLEDKTNTVDFVCCLQHLQVLSILPFYFYLLTLLVTVYLLIQSLLFSNPLAAFWYLIF